MTTATITFNNITEIGKNELAISGLKSSRKGLSDEITTKKVESYALLIADLATAGVKLTSKGLLPTNVSKKLKADLLEAGVTDACVHRYVLNTTGLLRADSKYFDVGRHGVSQVLVELDKDGLTTESKIKERGFGKKDPIEELAKKIVALDDADRVRLDEAVKGLEEAKAEEAEKLAKAEAEADAINATIEALEEAAA
jgi:hypothetical protein